MASRNVPGLGLNSEWDLYETSWKTGMDENLWRLSLLVQTQVLDFVLEEPEEPEQGDIYIVTDGDDVNKIFVYDLGNWAKEVPFPGQLIYRISNKEYYRYDDTGGWIPLLTPSRIKEIYESNANTNAYTDTEKSKLAGIENNATADMSNAEIKIAYEANANTNAFTDSEKVKLAGLSASNFLGIYTTLGALQAAHPSPSAGAFAYVDGGPSVDIIAYIWDNDGNKYVAQASTNALETPETIKSKYESNDDTNAFTDAYKDILDNLSNGDNLIVIETKTANYILTEEDVGKYIRMNVGVGNTLTVPVNSSEAIPVGAIIQVRQAGAGQTTIVADSGVTIVSPETLKLRKQGSSAALIKVAEDIWDITGDLEVVE